MSQGTHCTSPREHRPSWVVTARNINHSAFNGYNPTPSAYSQVRCLACWQTWRTKAKYVDTLPDSTSELIRSHLIKQNEAPAAEPGPAATKQAKVRYGVEGWSDTKDDYIRLCTLNDREFARQASREGPRRRVVDTSTGKVIIENGRDVEPREV